MPERQVPILEATGGPNKAFVASGLGKVQHRKVAERVFVPGATVCLSNRASIPSRTD